jgi:hypothetical protein
VGNYCWRAEFVSSTPGVPPAKDAAASECFTVVPVVPAITTDASADSPGVSIGTPINDIATLSGAASQPANPVINKTGTAGAAAGGSITFRLYGPADTSCTGTPVYSNTVTVTGNGNYNSGNYTPTAAGTYRWIASYTGNSPNTSGPVAGACGDTNEVSVVKPNPTSIITVATGAAGLPLGSSISDTATLSGATATAGGTIIFKAYGPDDATCSGAAVFTSAAIAVNGPGNYPSGSFTPNAAGTYRWTVAYSGDANNDASSGACNAANESSLITSIRVATSQFFYPNDTATITAVGGSNLQGTVRFRVFTNSGCSGTPVYDSGALSATTAAGVLTKTVSTANITNSVAGNVTVYWLVEFDSTNPQHADVNLQCGDERTQLIVTDKQ